MMWLDDLKAIVGPDGWKCAPDELTPHLNEWRGKYVGRSPILVAPANSDDVAAVVRRCADDRIGVVPQGGNTGMCAGAVPDASNTQVILSMARMNRIRSVDADNFSMEVEAGCILANIQAAAREADRHFPLSLGAEGSCQIGGNLATDAGGINVLRYGTARSQVLGLEVVLADGSVVSNLRSLRKDTAGYDLKQLFIGSEGTLGIITAATLKLVADPGTTDTALAAIETSGDAVRLLSWLRENMDAEFEAFELVSGRNFALVEKHIPGAQLPFTASWYVLMEVATRGSTGRLERALGGCLQDGLISDAVIAKNQAEADELWRLRHSISEAERAGGAAIKHDISVPLSSMQEFLDRGDALLERIAPDAELFAFGHVGDGNLHYNVRLGRAANDPLEVTAAIYDLVAEFGGSFSAEHGIGRMKREWLPKYRSETEMGLMKTLKNALDPDNILNPGKVI